MKAKFWVNFCDFFWTLRAFLLGKLGDKSYQIKNGTFRLPKSTTSKRIVMLMRWWGFQPATIKELKEIIKSQNHQHKT